MKKFLGGMAGVAFLLAVACAPRANASPVTYTLSMNNIGVSGTIGTVTVTDVSGGVQVSIAMNSGFSIKLNGGDIAFNLGTSATDTPGAISFDSITFGSTTITSPNISTGSVSSKNISQFGVFDFDIPNLMCAGTGTDSCGHGVVSADDLVFTVSGLTTADFGSGSAFAIHFCTASGSNCGPNTGFASNAPTAPTPEPGSLFLLGTGLIGLGAAVRRRLAA